MHDGKTNMAALSCDFWQCIDKLKLHLEAEYRIRQLRSLEEVQEAVTVVKLQELPRHEVIRKLEEVVEEILKDISKGKPPLIRYNSRTTWKNIRFNESVGMEMLDDVALTEVKFESRNSVGKFAATLQVISLCCKLLHENIYATKRDIYYTDVPFFGSQSIVDEVVDNLACMLKIPRHCLHVLAASKGFISGDLRYKEYDGTHVDCAAKTTGTPVSSHVEGIYDLYSEAKFILVVEKEATFQRLLDDNILYKLHPCIIVTGKGFPDINTRMMIHKLWSTFSIPILVLVDADPYGVEILCVYKFGSKSLSFAAHNLTLPATRWLGVLPSDIERLSISKNIQIPLTDKDKSKVQELLSRPYMKTQPAWRNEIEKILATGYKAEIQALSDISVGFLTDTYLPVKIRHGKWI